MGPQWGENFWIFLRIFFVIVNMGVKISKHYSLQIPAKVFQTCPEFSSQWSLQNYIGDFLILNFRFLTNFFLQVSNSQLWPMEKSKTSIIWKPSDRRAKRSEICDLWVIVEHT